MKFVSERDSASRLTQIRLVFRNGGLTDPSELPGLAHFTVRALLRGTRRRGYRQLTSDIERIGASLSVGVDLVQASVFGTVLHRNLDAFLDLVAEVLTEPAFEADEIERLRAILAGELRSRLQDPQVAARQAMLSQVYRGTPAARPSVGTLASLERITPDHVRQAYSRLIVRDRLVVGIASPDDPNELEKRVASKLAGLGASAGPVSELPPPGLRGRQAVIAERSGMSTVPLYMAIPGVADPEPSLPALELANFVFGADFTARLMQVLRAENGWTYGAYSGFSQTFSAHSKAGLFSLYTFPSAEFAALAMPKALELLDEFCAKGITDEEFGEASESLGNRCAFLVDTAEKRLSLKMREALTGRSYVAPDAYRRWLNALTASQVNEVISRTLSTRDLIVSAAGEASLLKPILTALPGVASVESLDVQP